MNFKKFSLFCFCLFFGLMIVSPSVSLAATASTNDAGYKACADYVRSLKAEGINYPYFVIYYERGSYNVVYSPTPLYFKGDGMYISGGVYYIGTYLPDKDKITGGRADGGDSEVGFFNKTTVDSAVLATTYNIKNENGDVVFQKPLIPGELAQNLPGEVVTQVKTILIVGVGLMALLVGSVVFLPRLVHLFVRS